MISENTVKQVFVCLYQSELAECDVIALFEYNEM